MPKGYATILRCVIKHGFFNSFEVGIEREDVRYDA
jgi:hypothetical protein